MELLKRILKWLYSNGINHHVRVDDLDEYCEDCGKGLYEEWQIIKFSSATGKPVRYMGIVFCDKCDAVKRVEVKNWEEWESRGT